MAQVTKLHKALLIMHSPTDDTVGIDNATHIFVAARHPKSFVSLAGADHLLSGKRDAAYVADVIAAWAERYVDPALPGQPAAAPDNAPRKVVVRETRNGKFQQTVSVGPHRLTADEPIAAGGDDSGPGPYDYVLAGLGACTSMTMRMYAERKSLPLARVTVTLEHRKISRGGLRRMRNQHGHARPDRAGDINGRRARRRTAHETDGNRRQVPGSPHPHLGDPYRNISGGLTSNPRYARGCDSCAGTSGWTRSTPRNPAAVPSNIPATATNDASARVERPVSPCPIEQP